METLKTKRFVITAIRYQMSGATDEEKTQKACDLVDGMPLPTQVYLKREPDNAWSRNAIAVYWKYSKIGYVSESDTTDILQAFGKPADGLLAATVTDKQGHLALGAEVEIGCDPSPAEEQEERQLQPSPFVIPMPIMEKENKVDLLAELLLPSDFAADDADRLIEMASQYVALAPSLCHCDCRNTSRLDRKLRQYRKSHPGLPSEKRERLHQLQEKAHALVTGIHREADRLAIFLAHLERMKEAFAAPGDGFFDRYDANYLHHPLCEADEDEMRAEIQRLTSWLDEVPRGIFHSHSWHPETIAPQLRYLHLSRREMYDVMGTVLVIKRLKQELLRRKAEATPPAEATHAIPEDCREAVRKVFTPTFTLPDKTVLNSQTQVARAAKLIDLASNVQVAMLMKVGMERKAVRPGTSCPDFVRALIGVGVMECADDRAIAKMADGMGKRLNGYTSKGKWHAPLPDSHLQWSTKDKPIGKKIYEAMAAGE